MKREKCPKDKKGAPPPRGHPDGPGKNLRKVREKEIKACHSQILRQAQDDKAKKMLLGMTRIKNVFDWFLRSFTGRGKWQDQDDKNRSFVSRARGRLRMTRIAF